MSRIVKFRVRQQGDVQFSGDDGYMVVGDGDAICFFIDPKERAYPMYSSTSETGCPVIGFESGEDGEEFTEIEFFEFPGWRVHAIWGGKVIPVALARREYSEERKA